MIVAMQYKHTAAALALLEGGADINVRDRAGQHDAASGRAGRAT